MENYLTLNVYWKESSIGGRIWVFDDKDLGLTAEPFVGATNTLIDILAFQAQGVTRMPQWDPPKKIKLHATRNADSVVHAGYRKATRIDLDDSYMGTWYSVDLGPLGEFPFWLCPVLQQYFPDTPAELFFKVELA